MAVATGVNVLLHAPAVACLVTMSDSTERAHLYLVASGVGGTLLWPLSAPSSCAPQAQPLELHDTRASMSTAYLYAFDKLNRIWMWSVTQPSS